MELKKAVKLLTPSQKAKSKYYYKNKEYLIKQINEKKIKRYFNDDVFRQKVLNSNKAYYEANKDKIKQYYLMKKQQKQLLISQ